MNNRLAAKTTGICSLAAGLLHFTVVALQHWAPFPPLETGFFFIVGLMQILLGVQFLHRPRIFTYYSSLLMNGGLAALYFLIQFLPVPFVGAPESLEALGLLVVSLELIVVGTSLRWLLTHIEHGSNRSLSTSIAAALIVTIFGGLGYYGSAQGMALLMPNRSVEHSHGSDHPHLNDEANFEQEKQLDEKEDHEH